MIESTERVHEIRLEMRKEMRISGVKDVECFDESGAVFHTVCGDMTVEGEGIRIGALDLEGGQVTLSGRIDSIFYSVEKSGRKRNFWGKDSR